MQIIVDRKISVRPGMEEGKTIVTEITRVLLGPFVINSHLYSSVNLTYITFLWPWFSLKYDSRICSSAMIVLRVNQPHVSDHKSVLAISLHNPSNKPNI